MGKVTKTGGPSGLIILGLIFFVFGTLMMWNNNKEKRFKATSGIIQTSEIKKITTTQSGASTSSISWYLLINYEYTVNGKTYKSDNISSEIPMSDAALNQAPSQELLRLAEKFKPNTPVTVYVSPKNFKKSILIHSPNYGIWGVIIGLSFFAGATYWYKLRSRR